MPHDDDILAAARAALAGQRHREALRLAQTALEAPSEPDPRREAHRLALQAAFFLDERELARRHGLAALRLAHEHGDALARARAHNDLAVLFGAHGLFEHALDHLWRSVHEAEAAGGEVEAGTCNNLGNVYLELGRHPEAVAAFERALTRFLRAGDEAGAALARSNVGRAHALAGRTSLAIPALDAALGAFERLGRQDDVTTTHAKLGVAHGVAGMPYHARRAFERALALHARGRARRLLPETRCWYGTWALRQGEIDTALRELQAAADACRRPDELARLGVLEPLSHALEAAGRVREALAALRRHLALDAGLRQAAAEAATRIRLLELELGLGGEQEVARLRTLELERANAALREEAARLEELSTTDALTGLRNRRALERRVHEEAAAAQRHGLPLVLALVDLDRFKAVNDGFSHETGDRVLCRVAELLLRNLRASDVAARWGGEEFALLLPGTRLEDAAPLLDRLRAAIGCDPWSRIEPGLCVTTSIGVASLEEVTDVPELLRLADRRLYAAKAGGRDRTVAFG